jgi:hypothetical protein
MSLSRAAVVQAQVVVAAAVIVLLSLVKILEGALRQSLPSP